MRDFDKELTEFSALLDIHNESPPFTLQRICELLLHAQRDPARTRTKTLIFSLKKCLTICIPLRVEDEPTYVMADPGTVSTTAPVSNPDASA